MKTGGTRDQHKYTIPIVPEILEQLEIPSNKADVMVAIIDQNYIGSNFRGSIPLGGRLGGLLSQNRSDGKFSPKLDSQPRQSAETRAKSIVEKASEIKINSADFFKLATIYYLCDTASYTENAPGGKRALDHLFEFRKDSSGQETMEFSDEAKGVFQILEDCVNEKASKREH